MALLFLLVGLVAADTQLGRADIPKGTMRRALTTSDTECSTELAACGADASCIACLEALQLQASACDLDDVLIPCEEIQGRFCCALEEEDENCEADAAFLAYVGMSVDTHQKYKWLADRMKCFPILQQHLFFVFTKYCFTKYRSAVCALVTWWPMSFHAQTPQEYEKQNAPKIKHDAAFFFCP